MSYNASFYQRIILDHNRNPRNFKKLDSATHHCSGNNPLCGDHITVYLKCEQDNITEISFEGSGCAISKASASIMTETLKGKSIDSSRTLSDKFYSMFTENAALSDDVKSSLGDLCSLENIKSTSSRIKCATLAWKAFIGALESQAEISSEKL